MDVLNMFHHVFWCGDLNYRSVQSSAIVQSASAPTLVLLLLAPRCSWSPFWPHPLILVLSFSVLLCLCLCLCAGLAGSLNYGGQGDAKSPTKEQFEDMVGQLSLFLPPMFLFRFRFQLNA